MFMSSPYENVAPDNWLRVTESLLNDHPLSAKTIVNASLDAWDLIEGAKIGHIIIGQNYFPTPQILGDYLHELIPDILNEKHCGWKKGEGSLQKDVVFTKDDHYSFEIKTSSQSSIYGNRSYAQQGTSNRKTKDKSGYYLAINFPPIHTLKKWAPITQIRFGWLDADDWRGQKAATGQQASLSPDVLNYKLITLYSIK